MSDELALRVLKLLKIEKKPKFPHYFEWALSHSSYANEKGTTSYERLEFLGDSIVGFVIAHKTFVLFGHMSEGEMAKIKAVVGSEPVLAEVSKKIGLSSLILTGKSLESATEEDMESIFADVFESTMAAVFLNYGFETVYTIISEFLTEKIKAVADKKLFFDYKTELQEYTQEHFGVLPEYVLIDERGPAHKKSYTFEVQIEGNPYGRGNGKSKKAAEQVAAKNALRRLKGL